jgi:hypothetical protein
MLIAWLLYLLWRIFQVLWRKSTPVAKSPEPDIAPDTQSSSMKPLDK